MGLVLVEDDESGILHKLTIQLLELLQRVLVMLTCALGQDVHPKVSIGDLFLIVLLIRRRELVSLPLEFLIGLFEVFLFLVETALDDRRTRQQAFL